MDEEIQTITHDKNEVLPRADEHGHAAAGDPDRPRRFSASSSDGPIRSTEVLGAKIAAALVGTLLGVFLSYSIVGPLVANIKSVREKQNDSNVIVKQTLACLHEPVRVPRSHSIRPARPSPA